MRRGRQRRVFAFCALHDAFCRSAEQAPDEAASTLSSLTAPDGVRAAAAAALGRMAVEDELPWDAPLLLGVNYRARSLGGIGAGLG